MDAANGFGQTALHWASVENRPAVVAILRDQSDDHASVDLRDGGGFTPLHFAAIEGNTDVMRHLLAAGTSRDIADDCGGTPLDYAEIHNHRRWKTQAVGMEQHSGKHPWPLNGRQERGVQQLTFSLGMLTSIQTSHSVLSRDNTVNGCC